MFPICQQLYTLGVEMDFTRNGDFTWRVPDCEELVGLYNTFIFPSLYNENGEELISSGTFM